MGSRTQAEEVLKRLPDGEVLGAEIGVFKGHMSKRLLERRDLILFMVDNWLPMPLYSVSADEQESNRLMAMRNAGRRGIILHMDSAEAAKWIPDGCLDFVFIDADHSYEGVKRDIQAWRPKLKAGGLLSGHDYANPGEKLGMEVKRAVDEIGPVELGLDSCWFYRV